MHLAIRADGGPDIGFGHLTRTNALAREWISTGGTVSYLTRTPHEVERVCADAVTVVSLTSVDDTDEVRAWLAQSDVSTLYVDSYELGIDFFADVLRTEVTLFVQVDDDERQLRCHGLVNIQLYAESLDYDIVGTEPRYCLGTDYFLLRPAVRAVTREVPPWRGTVDQVLVTMGGSDTQNMTPTVVRAFDGVTASVTVIVGPGFDNQAEITDAVAETDATFSVRREPPDLPQLMRNADLAVSAMGITPYELLATGTPLIGIPQADDPRQLLIGDAFNSHNLATILDPYPSSDRIGQAVEKLCRNHTQRRDLYDRGLALIDGQGAAKLVAEMRAEATS